MASNAQKAITAVAPVQSSDPTALTNYQLAVLTALCNSIVAEITANALVNVTSVSGVTSGSGTSGPGTGTVS